MSQETRELSHTEYYANLDHVGKALATVRRQLILRPNLLKPLGGIALVGSYGEGNPTTNSDLDYQIWADSTHIPLPKIDSYAYVISNLLRPILFRNFRRLDSYVSGVDFRDPELINIALTGESKVVIIHNGLSPMKKVVLPILNRLNIPSHWITV